MLDDVSLVSPEYLCESAHRHAAARVWQVFLRIYNLRAYIRAYNGIQFDTCKYACVLSHSFSITCMLPRLRFQQACPVPRGSQFAMLHDASGSGRKAVMVCVSSAVCGCRTAYALHTDRAGGCRGRIGMSAVGLGCCRLCACSPQAQMSTTLSSPSVFCLPPRASLPSPMPRP